MPLGGRSSKQLLVQVQAVPAHSYVLHEPLGIGDWLALPCWQYIQPPGLGPRYHEIAPAVKELYFARQQSTRQFMYYFQIGSRLTFYKILRFAGAEIPEMAPS